MLRMKNFTMIIWIKISNISWSTLRFSKTQFYRITVGPLLGRVMNIYRYFSTIVRLRCTWFPWAHLHCDAAIADYTYTCIYVEVTFLLQFEPLITLLASDHGSLCARTSFITDCAAELANVQSSRNTTRWSGFFDCLHISVCYKSDQSKMENEF